MLFGLVKALTFVALCAPLGSMTAVARTRGLGMIVIEQISRGLGTWTLVTLLLSLAATPARDLLGSSWPMRMRRMLGLIAFAYASLHFLFYLDVDALLDPELIAGDTVSRKFIVVGFAAWLLLVPLALTSTDRWVRRLGNARWRRLHRLAYVAAVLGVVHFAWGAKTELWRVVLAAGILSALLLARVVIARRRRSSSSVAPAAPRRADEVARLADSPSAEITSDGSR